MKNEEEIRNIIAEKGFEGFIKEVRKTTERQKHETEILNINVELWDYLFKGLYLIVKKIEQFNSLKDESLTKKIEELVKKFEKQDSTLDKLRLKAEALKKSKETANPEIKPEKLSEEYYSALEEIEKEAVAITYFITKEITGEILLKMKSDAKIRILGAKTQEGKVTITAKRGIINNFISGLKKIETSYKTTISNFEKDTQKRNNQVYAKQFNELLSVISLFKSTITDFNKNIEQLEKISKKAEAALLKDDKNLKGDYEKALKSVQDVENIFIKLQSSIKHVREAEKPEEAKKTKSNIESFMKELNDKLSKDKLDYVIKTVKKFTQTSGELTDDEKKFYEELGKTIFENVLPLIGKLVYNDTLYNKLVGAVNGLRVEIISRNSNIDKAVLPKLNWKEILDYSEKSKDDFLKGLAMESAALEAEILGEPIGEWKSSEMGKRVSKIASKLEEMSGLIKIEYSDLKTYFKEETPRINVKKFSEKSEEFIKELNSSLKVIDEISVSTKALSNHFSNLMKCIDKLFVFIDKLEKGIDEYKKEMKSHLEKLADINKKIEYREMNELIKKGEPEIRISTFISWANRRDLVKYVDASRKIVEDIKKDTKGNVPFILTKITKDSEKESFRKGVELLGAVDLDLDSKLKKFSSYTASSLAEEFSSRINKNAGEVKELQGTLASVEEFLKLADEDRAIRKKRMSLKSEKKSIEESIKKLESAPAAVTATADKKAEPKKDNTKEIEEKKKKFETLEQEIKKLNERKSAIGAKMAVIWEQGRTKFDDELKAYLSSSIAEINKPSESGEETPKSEKTDKLKNLLNKRSNDLKSIHKDLRVLTDVVNQDKNKHVLTFVADLISSYEGIKVDNPKEVRAVIHSWANGEKYKKGSSQPFDKYLKELSGAVEKSVLDCISTFKRFAVVFFSTERVVAQMVRVLSGYEIIKENKIIDDFISYLLSPEIELKLE